MKSDKARAKTRIRGRTVKQHVKSRPIVRLGDFQGLTDASIAAAAFAGMARVRAKAMVDAMAMMWSRLTAARASNVKAKVRANTKATSRTKVAGVREGGRERRAKARVKATTRAKTKE